MDLQSVLKSSDDFKILQEESRLVAGKWDQLGLLEGLNTEWERLNMARMLENQAKHIVSENVTGTGASFSSGEGEQWAGIVLPLVRKVFAQFASKDFVSVQPMNLPSGLVFYLDFKYGSDNSGFKAGQNMYGNVSTYNDKMEVDEEVSGGLYGAGRFGYSINDLTSALSGVATGSVSLADVNYKSELNTDSFTKVSVNFASGGDLDSNFPTGASNFDREGVRGFRLLSGSSDVAVNEDYPEFTTVSGSVVTFVILKERIEAGATDFDGKVVFHVQPTDNARGDFEDRDPNNPIDIPEIEVELGSEPITAKTRKLKAKWTPEFSQDLNAYHSIDAEAELTSLLSDYIAMEIDLEIMDMLIQNAVTTERWSAKSNRVWNGTAWENLAVADGGYYNTQGQWFQTLGTKVQKISNKIHQKTLRGGANFLVVSPNVATILESIPGYAADTNGDKMDFAMGVQKAGSLNSRFKVYKNPYMTEQNILMGYRGSQFLEAGAVYAPYVPLIMTPLVYDPETFTPRKGLMTRYAKKMIRPEFYGRIFVSDLNTI